MGLTMPILSADFVNDYSYNCAHSFIFLLSRSLQYVILSLSQFQVRSG